MGGIMMTKRVCLCYSYSLFQCSWALPLCMDLYGEVLLIFLHRCLFKRTTTIIYYPHKFPHNGLPLSIRQLC